MRAAPDAAADTVTLPETAAPAAGAVIATTGGAAAWPATVQLHVDSEPMSASTPRLLSVERDACSVRKA